MTLSHAEPSTADRKSGWLNPATLLFLLPAGMKLLVQLLAVGGYGLNGDELYYLACSDHLDWGFVDHPPLSIVLLHFQRMIAGDSMMSIRLLPALAGCCTVLLTGLLARRMGAGIFGQFLAELCVLVAPVYLALDHMFSMNAFDLLFWAAALYIMVRIIDGGPPSLWVWFGLVLGCGFENKISMLFLGFGLAVGLLLTPQRKLLLSPWTWVGALLAGLLVLPYVLWQISHGWPTLEWIHNARTQKMAPLSLPAFLVEQIVLMQPLTVLIWGTGLVALFVHPALKRYRSLGWCYIAALAVFMTQGGKAYYLAPIYPLLFASGSIVMERWMQGPRARTAIAFVLLGAGALTAPLGLPLLPVETFISYQEKIGLRPSSGERFAEGKLPSFFANMFGWEKLAATVDSVFQTLTPEDRARCGVYCQNYMQAGAIDFYGRQWGLPHAMSGHNNYWLWGMHGCTGDVLIVLGDNAVTLKKYFGEVTEMARFRDEYIQPIHNNLPIFLVRKPKQPLALLWPGVKEFI